MPRPVADIPPPNPSGLCMCGCGSPTPIARDSAIKRGILAGHPIKYILGHHGRVRFGKCDFSKPQYTVDEHGCWIWNHGTRAGYGTFNGEYVHRLSYTRCKGEIPDNTVIDHLCFNRLCVNPCHLEA